MPVVVLVVGSINIDDIVRVSHVVRRGETIASQSHVVLAGGKGANQAVAVARALDLDDREDLGEEDVQVVMAGKVGPDGQWVLDKLQGLGVHNTLSVVDPQQLTGRAWIQVDDSGDNAIVLRLGANHAFTQGDLERIFGSTANAGDIILVLQNEMNGLDRVVEMGLAHGHKVVLNAAPFSPSIASLPLERLNTLFVNEIEGRALAQLLLLQQRQDKGTTTTITTEDQAMATLAAALPNVQIVMTLGERGVLGYDPSAKTAVRVAAAPVTTEVSLLLPCVKKVKTCIIRSSRRQGRATRSRASLWPPDWSDRIRSSSPYESQQRQPHCASNGVAQWTRSPRAGT